MKRIFLLTSFLFLTYAPQVWCDEVQEMEEESFLDFSADLRSKYTFSIEEDGPNEREVRHFGNVRLDAQVTEQIKIRLVADLGALFARNVDHDGSAGERLRESIENGTALVEIHEVGGYPLVIVLGKMNDVGSGDDVAFGSDTLPRSDWSGGIAGDQLGSLRTWTGVVGVTARLTDMPSFLDTLEATIFESDRGDMDVSGDAGYAIKLTKDIGVLNRNTRITVSYLNVDNMGEREFGEIYDDIDEREKRLNISASMDLPEYNSKIGMSVMRFEDNVDYSDTSDTQVGVQYQYYFADDEWIHGEYSFLDEHSQSYSLAYWRSIVEDELAQAFWGVGARKFEFEEEGKNDSWVLGTQIRVLLNR